MASVAPFHFDYTIACFVSDLGYHSAILSDHNGWQLFQHPSTL